MRLGLIASAVALTIFGVACGDGGGDEGNGEPTALATSFPQALISGTMLTPEDIGPGFTQELLSNPPGPSGRSVNALYRSPTMYIQSTVIFYPDVGERDRMFVRNRQVSQAFGAQEENYQVEGLDLAFREKLTGNGQSTWGVIGDNWLLYVQASTLEQVNPDPRATDPAYLAELTRIVGERVHKLIADPGSITPLSGVAQATFPAGAGEYATPTP